MTRGDALLARTVLAASLVCGAEYTIARQHGPTAEPRLRPSNVSPPTLTFTKDIAPIVF